MTNSRIKFFIDQHGCAKNQTDAELIAGFLVKKGLEHTLNPDEADYCVKCGSPLIFKQDFDNQSSLNPIIIQRNISDNAQSYNGPRTSRIVILLGYIFSILGGLLGLIIAIYLITRKDPVAKRHGRIQLLIFIFYLGLLLILLLTGTINSDTIMQYSQLNLANLTNQTL